jgi:hypothetical protein
VDLDPFLAQAVIGVPGVERLCGVTGYKQDAWHGLRPPW